MAYYNSNKIQEMEMSRQNVSFDYGIIDGMGAAAADTIRTLPISSVAREVSSWLDDSETIDPFVANEQFGLEGEAAFKDGEEVTKDMAAARAQDQADIAANEFIMSSVNEDSPVLGRLTQFGASMAAGFTDPLLFAAGAGAHVAIARGIGAIGASAVGRAVTSKLLESSPRLGNMLVRSYSDKIANTTAGYLFKEGSENLLASVAEETINFAGVGEERLARKVTAQESLMNIALGTALGTGFGMLLDKGARQSMLSSYNRLMGDDAGNIILTDAQVKDFEMKLGIESDNTHLRIMDEDTYDAKPWHETMDDTEGERLYISVSEDKELHSYSNRGEGIVTTNNIHHAQNKGASVREVDADSLNLLPDTEIAGRGDGRTPRVKAQIMNNLVQDFLENTTDAQLTKVAAHLIDPTVDSSIVKVSRVRTQLKKDIKAMLAEATTLDEMFDTLEKLGYAGGIEHNSHRVVDTILANNGYDGYTFNVNRFTGEGTAYKGTYIRKESLENVGFKNEFDSPKPDNFQIAEQRMLDKQRLQNYHASLKDRIAKIGKAEKDIANSNKIEGAAPLPTKKSQQEVAENPSLEEPTYSTASSVYNTNAKQRAAIDEQIEELLEKSRKKALTVEESEDLKILQSIQKNEDINTKADDLVKKIEEYADCRTGRATKKTANYAEEQDDF